MRDRLHADQSDIRLAYAGASGQSVFGYLLFSGVEAARLAEALLEEIERAMDRDTFMEADEAKAFGIIDEVFDKRPDAGEDSGTGAADVIVCPYERASQSGILALARKLGARTVAFSTAARKAAKKSKA